MSLARPWRKQPFLVRRSDGLVALALAWLDDRRDFPAEALPSPQAA